MLPLWTYHEKRYNKLCRVLLFLALIRLLVYWTRCDRGEYAFPLQRLIRCLHGVERNDSQERGSLRSLGTAGAPVVRRNKLSRYVRKYSTCAKGHPWLNRPNYECHGADRARCISLVNLRSTMSIRSADGRCRHVVWHRRCAAALFGDCDFLRRVVKTLSRRRFFVLLRRTGFSIENQGLQVCANREIRGWMGQSSLLLVYPGVMVGVTALLVGYLLGQLFPSVFNSAVPSPVFMILFSLVFPFLVGYIAYRGVTGATSVNIAINVIQISALVVFSVIAIAYRVNHASESSPTTLQLTFRRACSS